ncbi:unnamed protein product [Cladocopium goreaui]|uniref:Acetyl-CoA carboxylase (ACC) (Fatty aci d synthetase 3) (mRNA transport-defective protein 7) n=1 Tax=Cladocopium goreaui TaxID=2562237 RepID=A0A9P1FHK2_9DINO|nr:unnamed protein product [Cladocopium goreaui]
MAAAKVMMSMRQWAHMEALPWQLVTLVESGNGVANLGERNILEFVAMATKEDLDANAEFIRLADQHVEVPGDELLHRTSLRRFLLAMQRHPQDFEQLFEHLRRERFDDVDDMEGPRHLQLEIQSLMQTFLWFKRPPIRDAQSPRTGSTRCIISL